VSVEEIRFTSGDGTSLEGELAGSSAATACGTRAARAADVTSSWRSTTLEVVPGASHFFVGRSAEVATAVFTFCAAICR